MRAFEGLGRDGPAFGQFRDGPSRAALSRAEPGLDGPMPLQALKMLALAGQGRDGLGSVNMWVFLMHMKS